MKISRSENNPTLKSLIAKIHRSETEVRFYFTNEKTQTDRHLIQDIVVQKRRSSRVPRLKSKTSYKSFKVAAQERYYIKTPIQSTTLGFPFEPLVDLGELYAEIRRLVDTRRLSLFVISYCILYITIFQLTGVYYFGPLLVHQVFDKHDRETWSIETDDQRQRSKLQ